jgi:hypothetical protein
MSTEVKDSKKSKNALNKQGAGARKNTPSFDTVSRLGEGGNAEVPAKKSGASQQSANGQGIPAHESRKMKLGAELKRAHANNARRENNQADPEGGEQL